MTTPMDPANPGDLQPVPDPDVELLDEAAAPADPNAPPDPPAAG